MVEYAAGGVRKLFRTQLNVFSGGAEEGASTGAADVANVARTQQEARITGRISP
jgi:hypothetical protein